MPAGSDIIVGGKGNDEIHSNAGADLILGDGPDQLPDNLPSADVDVQAYLTRVGNIG